MKKVAFFAFQGNKMCFMHLLLNAMDLKEKGHDALIVVEGQAVKLLKELEEEENKVYLKAKDLGIFASICKACSQQMGVLEYNEGLGIPINGDMFGHPPMSEYLEKGYEIITL